MLGLYVHIPFCARRCPYCNFAIHIGARENFVADYLAMLRRELEAALDEQVAYAAAQPLTSIYFGGGTPTSLSAEQLADLLRLIRDRIAVAPDAEISIEANPDGLDEAKLTALCAAGWNRISFGAQSFDDAALKQLGRTHTAAQIEAVFEVARRAGFNNINVDLIFAVPGQSRASWQDTLARATALRPEHLSCYSLTVETGTPFARRVQQGRLIPVENDEQAVLMQDAERILHAAGWRRYEVSNYARPGYECRHNLNYWRGGDYLACGCGAHGHRQGHRWWNERAAPRYVSLIRERGTARVGEEWLTPRERLNEIVLLGLRLSEGFHLDEVSRQLGLDARGELNGRLQNLMAHGLLQDAQGTIRLAPQAVPLADAVAARLLA
ncbi:MAG: radical SAM family heme chaperone HemW [Armatimonadota bacterium]|nr:radical SAM family heme chaperone HemW [Armatimonadota bacterium]